MTTMNISLPDSLKLFVDEQVAEAGYGTSSEFVRDLIRRERDRLALRNLLLEGPASGVAEPLEPDYFDNLRAKVRGKAK